MMPHDWFWGLPHGMGLSTTCHCIFAVFFFKSSPKSHSHNSLTRPVLL